MGSGGLGNTKESLFFTHLYYQENKIYMTKTSLGTQIFTEICSYDKKETRKLSAEELMLLNYGV